MSLKPVKCVVWELDGTLWRGTLLEDAEVEVASDTLAVLSALEDRGIINAIATRNDPASARAAVHRSALADRTVALEAGWEPKSVLVGRLLGRLRVAANAVVFVDDDPFERAEVSHVWPGIEAIDPARSSSLLVHDRLAGNTSTESRRRAALYRAEAQRDDASRKASDRRTFLDSCRIRLHIRQAARADFHRICELSHRTHRYNSSRRLYTPAELEHRHILVGHLTDRFADDGLVVAAIISGTGVEWEIETLMASCRVEVRGVAPAFVRAVVKRAADAGAVRLAVPVPVDGASTPLRVVMRQLDFAADLNTDAATIVFRRDTATLPPAVASWVGIDG
jgi:FkbH-like protein